MPKKPVKMPSDAQLEKENKFDTKRYQEQMKEAEGKQRPGKTTAPDRDKRP